MEVQGHTLGRHRGERVEEVRRVEPRGQRLALEVDLDLLVTDAEVWVVGGEFETAIEEFDLDRRRLLGRHHLGALEHVDDLGAVCDDAARVLLRDDLVVRREDHVVEFDREGQVSALQIEVLAVDSETDLILGAVKHAFDLQHALAWDDDGVRERRAGEGERQLGEAMAVGGDHRAGGAVALEEHAVEVDAGLVGGDAERRLLDEVREHGAGDLGEGDVAGVRQVGEVRGGLAHQLELAAAHDDLRPVVLHALDAEGLRGQRADHVVQVADAEGDGAGSLDLNGDGLGDGDHQVGRAANQLVVLGRPQKHVGEDRLVVAPLVGDGLRESKRGEEFGLVDLEVEEGLTCHRGTLAHRRAPCHLIAR